MDLWVMEAFNSIIITIINIIVNIITVTIITIITTIPMIIIIIIFVIIAASISRFTTCDIGTHNLSRGCANACVCAPD